MSIRSLFASVLASFLIAVPMASAAGAAADHFEVVVSPNAKVGEALDMTVKVMDKDGKVKKDYAGTIYITVDNDSKATIPYADGYTFTTTDQGLKTFSKGLSFTKEGKMKVTVMDVDNDSLEGYASLSVTAGSGATGTGKEVVAITSPTDNSTVSDTKITVTGTAKKNSKIEIHVDGKKDGSTQTDEAGNFVYEVKSASMKELVIQAKVLDGTDKIAGESTPVKVKIEAQGPVFKTLVVKEGKTIAPSTTLNLEVMADPGLKEVTAAIGTDTPQVLMESESGKYAGVIQAPATAGEYAISVNLKNSLGKVTSKDNAEIITVTAPVVVPPTDTGSTATGATPAFKNIKAETGDKRVTFTFSVENEPKEIVRFKISYGTGDATAPLTNDSLTYEKDRIKTLTSEYSWYVGELDNNQKYAFRITALDVNDQPITGLISDPVEVDFLSATTTNRCMIAKVSGVRVIPGNDSSKLVWDSLMDATSYNVYKKAKDGTWNLIENVKTNEYPIYLDPKTVSYDDFSIKAVCGNGDAQGESTDYSDTTRVQTGPIHVAAMMLIALTVGYFVSRRKFAYFRR